MFTEDMSWKLRIDQLKYFKKTLFVYGQKFQCNDDLIPEKDDVMAEDDEVKTDEDEDSCDEDVMVEDEAIPEIKLRL